MVDRNLLCGKIVSCGFSQVSLAKVLGMSKNTLNASINNKRPFNSDEILTLCELLQISEDAEKIRIFLASPSQNRDMQEQDAS